MGISQRLRLGEVREVFWLLSDARDLRHDPVQQEKLIVDSMVRLLDADFGHAIRYGEFRPSAPTHVKQIIYGTVQDHRAMAYFSEYGSRHPISDDPMKPVTLNKRGPIHTTSREREFTLAQLQAFPVYEELVVPARINDGLLTFFRYPNSNDTRGYSFIRTLDKPCFTPRQIKITHLLCSELYRLYMQGELEEPDPMDKLPGRLAKLVRDLMTGMSQKQIAHRRGLTYTTVRSYTKELYGMMGVNSRQALMAKLMQRDRTRKRPKQ